MVQNMQCKLNRGNAPTLVGGACSAHPFNFLCSLLTLTSSCVMFPLLLVFSELATLGWLFVCLMVFSATFNNVSYIVAVSFISGGNRMTQRKLPICRMSQFWLTLWFCLTVFTDPIVNMSSQPCSISGNVGAKSGAGAVYLLEHLRIFVEFV
jgi:hypothetical protein